MVKKILIFISLIFLSCDAVYAFDFCTASKEYIEYKSLPLEEQAKYIEPIYCEEILNNKIISSLPIGGVNSSFSTELSASNTDTYYNAYNDGIVNTPGNQQQTGMCWSFSAISVVETNAAKNGYGLYNFSEAHMGYSILGQTYSDQNGLKGRFNYGTSGGTIAYAPTYFFNGYGQKLESDMPFDDNLTANFGDLVKIDSNNYSFGDNIISVGSFYLDNLSNTNGVCSDIEINTIKNRILEYGSVQATMYMDAKLFKNHDNQYYLSTISNASSENHGVVIVGWDDTISKNNFNGATRNGAWIIKNSWGSDWSNDGLFYISYDDHFICNTVATFGDVSTKRFDYTYKSADVVGVHNVLISGTQYFSTNYTKQSDEVETLDRVSFPVDSNLSYKVYLASSNTTPKSNWVLLASGTSTNYGIISVDISNVKVSSDFTIIVEYKVENNEDSAIMLMTNILDDTKHLEISRNTNYISEDGITWGDLYNYGAEPNIYAYTSRFVDKISSKSSNLVINKNELDIIIDRNTSYKYGDLVNSLNINGSTFTVKDVDGNLITDNSTLVGTGSIVITDNAEYKIVILGDVTGDATINSADLIRIVKHLKKSATLSTEQLLASDPSRDGVINSADLMKIVKYLKGISTISL